MYELFRFNTCSREKDSRPRPLGLPSLALRASVAFGALLMLAQIAAADVPQPLIERLDERTRGKVILALAGLVLLGFLLIGLTWLAFRIARRRIREAQQVLAKHHEKAASDYDWAAKPLSEQDENSS